MSRASLALSNAMFLEIVNGLHSLNQTLIEKDRVITRLREEVQSLQVLVGETRLKAMRLEGRNTVLETENSQLKAELENNKQKMRSAVEFLIDGNDSVGRKVKDKLVSPSQAAKQTARKTTNVTPLPRAAVKTGKTKAKTEPTSTVVREFQPVDLTSAQGTLLGSSGSRGYEPKRIVDTNLRPLSGSRKKARTVDSNLMASDNNILTRFYSFYHIVHPIPAATAKATVSPQTIFTLKRKMAQGGSEPSRLPILTIKKLSDTKPKDPNIMQLSNISRIPFPAYQLTTDVMESHANPTDKPERTFRCCNKSFQTESDFLKHSKDPSN
ncbi:unnamed protein product [Orchesella dallaii]|uniref:C2H2-type domain-containing protein n=1 Tax=Orchesella dallaii TaxID=48710 RepID=A0ABP1R6N9_9HEXA